GQLESMGSVLRNQPGMQAFLSTIIPGYKGGNSLNAENQLQLVNTLKGQMGESGYYVASQFAQSFGMNENVFRQMWTNVDELNAAYEDHNKLLKELGLNTEKSSKDFVDFDRELTKSKTILTDVFTSIESWAAEHIGTPTLAAVNEASRAAIRAPGNKPGSNVGSPVSEFGASILESLFGFGHPSDTTNTSSGVAGSTSPITSGGNAQANMVSWLQGQGIAPRAAMGAMVGMTGESGPNLDPGSFNNTSGASGILNWLGPRKEEFKRRYGAYPDKTNFPQQLR